MFIFWVQFWSLETFLDYSHFGGKWANVQFLVLSYFASCSVQLGILFCCHDELLSPFLKCDIHSFSL